MKKYIDVCQILSYNVKNIFLKGLPMFSSIIENFQNPQFWTKTKYGYSFPLNSNNLATYDQIRWFFKHHGISFDYQNGRFEIDDSAYKMIQKAFQYTSRPKLIFQADIYDTLSDDDWQYLENHVRVLYNTMPKHPTTRDKLIAQIDTRNFLRLLRESHMDSLMKNRLLNEFIQICRSREEEGHSSRLDIDMSQKALDKLTAEKADALHIRNGQQQVYSKRPGQVSDELLVSNLFHELRHVIQEEHGLSSYPSSQKKTSGVYLAIRELAIEAEAKAYTLLLESNKKSFVTKMLQSHTNNIADALSQDTESFSANHGFDENGIAATLRYLRIRSEEETLETLCNVFLAQNRRAALQVLQNDNVHFSVEEFNSLLDCVEEWKASYMPRIMQNIPQNKKDIPVSFFEMEDLQKYWEKAGGVHMNMEPLHVFSTEVAQNLGVYRAIYGEDAPNTYASRTFQPFPRHHFGHSKSLSDQRVYNILNCGNLRFINDDDYDLKDKFDGKRKTNNSGRKPSSSGYEYK